MPHYDARKGETMTMPTDNGVGTDAIDEVDGSDPEGDAGFTNQDVFDLFYHLALQDEAEGEGGDVAGEDPQAGDETGSAEDAFRRMLNG
jgi:hypothetical protein